MAHKTLICFTYMCDLQQVSLTTQNIQEKLPIKKMDISNSSNYHSFSTHYFQSTLTYIITFSLQSKPMCPFYK